MSITLEEFLEQIARKESRGDYTAQNPTTGSYGKYQIMPKNWKEWAPKALGTVPREAVASKDIPPAQWLPPTTPENQEVVAMWRADKLSRALGHQAQRMAGAWLSGPSRVISQPVDWSDRTIGYVNRVLWRYRNYRKKFVYVNLGFEQLTRETVLPELP